MSAAPLSIPNGIPMDCQAANRAATKGLRLSTRTWLPHNQTKRPKRLQHLPLRRMQDPDGIPIRRINMTSGTLTATSGLITLLTTARSPARAATPKQSNRAEADGIVGHFLAARQTVERIRGRTALVGTERNGGKAIAARPTGNDAVGWIFSEPQSGHQPE